MKGLISAAPLTPEQLAVAVDSFGKLKTGVFSTSPDKQIVEIVKQYNSEQIQQINKAYYEKHSNSISQFIAKMIKDNDCQDLTLLVLGPRHDSWAKLVNTALKDMSENSDLLVTSILMMDPEDVYRTKVAYKIRFNNPMEQDIMHQLKGNSFWERLVLAWLRRDAPGFVSARFNTKQEAKELLAATTGLGTNDAVYVKIMSQSTTAEFQKIAEEFQSLTTRGITECTKREQAELEAKYNADYKKKNYNQGTAEEKLALDTYMRTKTTKSFTDVIDSEFTKKSLDNFTAKLAFYKLSDTETALKFIFNNSFNEATEYQQGTGGNVDKPMMNFLIAVQRDKFVLDEKMNSLLKKKFLMKTGSYDDAVKGYFGMK
ncbi:Annexin_11 [Hexamita inflata]|uniref:Annexin 11 n=1 Tax=Hexamita inflata TaxID=28002 RepID=A0AA86UNV5_9EUKA|nr:Annexin 11 [Hexamita inflata]